MHGFIHNFLNTVPTCIGKVSSKVNFCPLMFYDKRNTVCAHKLMNTACYDFQTFMLSTLSALWPTHCYVCTTIRVMKIALDLTVHHMISPIVSYMGFFRLFCNSHGLGQCPYKIVKVTIEEKGWITSQ